MNVEKVSSVVVDTAFHLHRDLGQGLLELVYEAVLARMLEERRLRVERQVSVAFDFNSMHFDEELRAFASSREAESRGHAKTLFSVRWKTFCWNCRTASLRLANRYIRQGPSRTDEPHGCSQGAQVGEEVQR